MGPFGIIIDKNGNIKVHLHVEICIMIKLEEIKKFHHVFNIKNLIVIKLEFNNITILFIKTSMIL
jgi:hypothetical protein